MLLSTLKHHLLSFYLSLMQFNLKNNAKNTGMRKICCAKLNENPHESNTKHILYWLVNNTWKNPLMFTFAFTFIRRPTIQCCVYYRVNKMHIFIYLHSTKHLRQLWNITRYCSCSPEIVELAEFVSIYYIYMHHDMMVIWVYIYMNNSIFTMWIYTNNWHKCCADGI